MTQHNQKDASMRNLASYLSFITKYTTLTYWLPKYEVNKKLYNIEICFV